MDNLSEISKDKIAKHIDFTLRESDLSGMDPDPDKRNSNETVS